MSKYPRKGVRSYPSGPSAPGTSVGNWRRGYNTGQSGLTCFCTGHLPSSWISFSIKTKWYHYTFGGGGVQIFCSCCHKWWGSHFVCKWGISRVTKSAHKGCGSCAMVEQNHDILASLPLPPLAVGRVTWPPPDKLSSPHQTSCPQESLSHTSHGMAHGNPLATHISGL